MAGLYSLIPNLESVSLGLSITTNTLTKISGQLPLDDCERLSARRTLATMVPAAPAARSTRFGVMFTRRYLHVGSIIDVDLEPSGSYGLRLSEVVYCSWKVGGHPNAGLSG